MAKHLDHSTQDTEDGLYTKYRVFYEPDDTPSHPASIHAAYVNVDERVRLLKEVEGFIFPLKPDSDHHARIALAAYAISVREEKPALSEDLMDLLDDLLP